MTTKEFKEILLDTIKVKDYKYKSELIELFKFVYVEFEKTSNFTRRSWQYYENIILRIRPDYLARLQEHIKYLSTLCYDIYEETDEYDSGNVVIKPGRKIADEDVNQDIFFEDIQNQIKEHIQNAKYTIWIAVAWFTDPVLYNELVKKKNQGVNVQIVMINDKINGSTGLNFENQFETIRVNPTGYFNNILHHKFCVIDLATAIHGSYNWTKKAQYNKETISIDNNRETAEKFASEFIKIKNSY